MDELEEISPVRKTWISANTYNIYAPKFKKITIPSTPGAPVTHVAVIVGENNVCDNLEEIHSEMMWNSIFDIDITKIILPSLRIYYYYGTSNGSYGGLIGRGLGTSIQSTEWHLPSIEKISGRFINFYGGSCSKLTDVYFGCKGEYPNTIDVSIGGYQTPYPVNCFNLEIGDYENINKGLPPRWQPKQSMYFYWFKALTRENVREHIIDRLAYNDIPNVTLRLGLHTDVYNRLTTEDLAEVASKKWSILFVSA